MSGESQVAASRSIANIFLQEMVRVMVIDMVTRLTKVCDRNEVCNSVM